MPHAATAVGTDEGELVTVAECVVGGSVEVADVDGVSTGEDEVAEDGGEGDGDGLPLHAVTVAMTTAAPAA